MNEILTHVTALYYIEYYACKTERLTDISEVGYATLEDCLAAIEEQKAADLFFENELMENYEEKLREFVFDLDMSDREPQAPNLNRYRYDMKPHRYIRNENGYNEVTE